MTTTQLLALDAADFREIAQLLRELGTGPERWRESIAIRRAETAMARIKAASSEPWRQLLFESRRAIEESRE